MFLGCWNRGFSPRNPRWCQYKLTLTEVLYSPEIRYTLISIGKLDVLGFCIVFEDSQCTIYLPDNAMIGKVLKSACGLYPVVKAKSLPVEDIGDCNTCKQAADGTL